MPCVELLQGVGIEVIVVVVTDAYSVDFGKVLERTRRGCKSDGANHAVGTHTLTPYWIEQDAHTSLRTLFFWRLDQEARMADPRRLEAILVCPEIWFAHLDEPYAVSGNRNEILGRVEARLQDFGQRCAGVGRPRVAEGRGRVRWRVLVRVRPSGRQGGHGDGHGSTGVFERFGSSSVEDIADGSNGDGVDVRDGIYGLTGVNESAVVGSAGLLVRGTDSMRKQMLEYDR